MAAEANVAGLVANAANADSCPFVFSDATHPHDSDALTALRRVIVADDHIA